jgi:hypothetical protein
MKQYRPYKQIESQALIDLEHHTEVTYMLRDCSWGNRALYWSRINQMNERRYTMRYIRKTTIWVSIQSREQATNNVEFRGEKIVITNSNGGEGKEDESFAARCIPIQVQYIQ